MSRAPEPRTPRGSPSRPDMLHASPRSETTSTHSKSESFGDEFWKAITGASDTEGSTSGTSSRPLSSISAQSLPIRTGTPELPADLPPEAEVTQPPGLASESNGNDATSRSRAKSATRGPRPPTSRKQSYRPLPPVPDPSIDMSSARAGPAGAELPRRTSSFYGKELPSPPHRSSPDGSEADSDEEKNLQHPYLARTTERKPPVPLDLSRRNLSSIPENLPVDLSKLTILLLSRNRLTHLSPSVWEQMPHLTVLDVSENQLKSVPSGLGRLKELRELFLAGNGIERLESELGACARIEVVVVARNRLYEIAPSALVTLAHLRVLDLSSNYLRTLPPSLHAVSPTLRRLFIDDNPIEQSLIKLVNPLLTFSRRQTSGRAPETGNLKSLLAGMARVRKDDIGIAEGLESIGSSNILSEEDKHSMASFDSGIGDVDKSRQLQTSRSVLEDDLRPHEPLARASQSESDIGRNGLSNRAVSTDYTLHLHRLLNYLRDVYDLNPLGLASPRTPRSSIEGLDAEASLLNKFGLADILMKPAPLAVALQEAGQAPAPTPPHPPSVEAARASDRRHQIVNEIVVTERTYVRELESLVALYVDPLKTEAIFSDKELDTVFGNVSSLLQYHKQQLLPDFEARVAESGQPLGAAFLSMVPFLSQYEAYYNHFDAATAFVALLDKIGTHANSSNQSNRKAGSAEKKRRDFKPLAKQFHSFSQLAKQHASHASQISLQSFLILPVQRLPRYKLLVDSLLKATDPSDPDHAACSQAAVQIASAVSQCNERKREFEAVHAGTTLLARIQDPSDPSGRTLLQVLEADPAQKEAATTAGPRLWFAGDLRIVKYVERDQAGALDLAAVVERATKKRGKKRVDSERVGRVLEWRVGKLGRGIEGELVSTDRIAGGQSITSETVANALAEHGITSLTGISFPFALVGDRLLWCSRSPRRRRTLGGAPVLSGGGPVAGELGQAVDADGDMEVMDLVRVLAGSKVTVIAPVAGGDTLVRVCDGVSVLYLVGSPSVAGRLVDAAAASAAGTVTLP
ncbi:Rho guanine nucleotide exchange factor 39 [Thoreauomyces humboldtii]|nr:Rho guanine nucleotide exchange factor 39 [Thoreauomyces humboldtii]